MYCYNIFTTRKLLEEAVNGNKVVARLLDSHITATGDSEDAADYRVELDFSGISDEASNQQTRCVYDLLDLKTKRTNHLAAMKGTNQDTAIEK